MPSVKKCAYCGQEVVYLSVELPAEKEKKMIRVDWNSLPPQDQRNYLENIKVIFDGRRGHMPHNFTCPHNRERK